MPIEKKSNKTRGGARPNAGRKKGSPNKTTQEQREAIKASGLTPLEYMLRVMRDEDQDEARRLHAANMAAPYVHAKLSSVELSGELTHSTRPQDLSDDELANIASGSSV
jgi:hypothetical protein